MDKIKIVRLLEDCNILIGDFYEHGKASECYVGVTFIQDDGFTWDTIVPYVNRRAGLFLETKGSWLRILKVSNLSSKNHPCKHGGLRKEKNGKILRLMSLKNFSLLC